METPIRGAAHLNLLPAAEVDWGLERSATRADRGEGLAENRDLSWEGIWNSSLNSCGAKGNEKRQGQPALHLGLQIENDIACQQPQCCRRALR